MTETWGQAMQRANGSSGLVGGMMMVGGGIKDTATGLMATAIEHWMISLAILAAILLTIGWSMGYLSAWMTKSSLSVYEGKYPAPVYPNNAAKNINSSSLRRGSLSENNANRLISMAART